MNSSEKILPAGVIRFRDVDLKAALAIYADLAQSQLEIDPQVRKVRTKFTFETSQPLAKSEAMRLFEEALRDQTGVVLKPLDGNRISVKLKGP